MGAGGGYIKKMFSTATTMKYVHSKNRRKGDNGGGGGFMPPAQNKGSSMIPLCIKSCMYDQAVAFDTSRRGKKGLKPPRDTSAKHEP